MTVLLWPPTALVPLRGWKVAYFAAFSDPHHDPEAPRPLVADANTAWALWDLCRLARSAERRDSYLEYVRLAHRWAHDKGWRADEVERALFDIGKTVPKT